MSTDEKFFEAAEHATQMIIENEIKRARAATTEQKLKPVQACYNCLEELEGDAVFCDADCRDDYQKRKRYGVA